MKGEGFVLKQKIERSLWGVGGGGGMGTGGWDAGGRGCLKSEQVQTRGEGGVKKPPSLCEHNN